MDNPEATLEQQIIDALFRTSIPLTLVKYPHSYGWSIPSRKLLGIASTLPEALQDALNQLFDKLLDEPQEDVSLLWEMVRPSSEEEGNDDEEAKKKQKEKRDTQGEISS